LVPSLFLDEASRFQEHDPVALGPDEAVLAQLAQVPHDDLPDGAHGVRQLLLASKPSYR
jgi:hypothetical protein